MSHYMHFELIGTASSPINPAWPPIGPVDIQWDMQYGQYTTIPGQIINAEITNFVITLNGQPYQSIPSGATADFLLSPKAGEQSGLSIHSPHQTFVWGFYGPMWSSGIGTLLNEETQIDFTFPHLNVTAYIGHSGAWNADPIVSMPEPGTLCLWAAAVLVFFLHKKVSSLWKRHTQRL